MWFAGTHIASIGSGDWDGHTAYKLTKKPFRFPRCSEGCTEQVVVVL